MQKIPIWEEQQSSKWGKATLGSNPSVKTLILEIASQVLSVVIYIILFPSMHFQEHPLTYWINLTGNWRQFFKEKKILRLVYHGHDFERWNLDVRYLTNFKWKKRSWTLRRVSPNNMLIKLNPLMLIYSGILTLIVACWAKVLRCVAFTNNLSFRGPGWY